MTTPAPQTSSASPELNTSVDAVPTGLSSMEATDARGHSPPERPASSDPAPTLIEPGAHFGGYRIEAKLGEGGMGTVWKALHLRLDKLVALKLLPQHLTRDAALVARFDREMKAVGKLEHPHIVRAMDAGEVGGTHYLVMEYVEGLDLSKLVRTKGPRSVVEACELVRQAALGLAHAHQHGLVHRDVKPSNLLLTKQGKVKILDLGLARLQSADEKNQPTQPDGLTLTGMGMCMGTPDYMAPEQWENTHTVDGRADLYALGCTFYFLLTGDAPYNDAEHKSLAKKLLGHTHETIPDLKAGRAAAGARVGGQGSGKGKLGDVPDAVIAVYQRLMAKKPEDRVQTAAELSQTLLTIVKALGSGGSGLATDTTPRTASAGSASGDQLKPAASGRREPAEPSENSPTNGQGTDALRSPAGTHATPTQPITAKGRPPATSKGAGMKKPDDVPYDDVLESTLQTLAPAPPRPSGRKTAGATGKSGRPPWSGMPTKVWLAVGGLAVVVLLAGIIIKITNKDGSTTKVELPEGTQKIEIEKDGKTVGKFPADTKPSVAASVVVGEDVERVVAEWVIRHGGVVSGSMHDGPFGNMTRLETLPPGPIVVTGISLYSKPGLPADEWKRLGNLRALESLNLEGCQVNDDIVVHLFEHLPTLLSVDADNNPALTDAVAVAAARHGRLLSVALSDSQISSAGVRELAKLDRMALLSLGRCQNVTDEALPALARLKRLETLYINGTGITSAGLEAFPSLPRLQLLYAAGLPWTPAATKRLLDCPELLTADLSYNDVSLDALRVLASHRSLALLGVNNIPAVSEANIARLQQDFPRCVLQHPASRGQKSQRELAVWLKSVGALNGLSCPWDLSKEIPEEPFYVPSANFSRSAGPPADLQRLATSQSLRAFGLVENWVTDEYALIALRAIPESSPLTHYEGCRSLITDATLEELAKRSRLTYVNLGECPKFTAAGMAELGKLTRLQALGIKFTAADDSTLAHFGGLVELQSLDLLADRITGAGLTHLKTLRELRVLGLALTPLEDSGLAALKDLPELRTLDVHDTPVTDAGLEHLRECRSLRILHLERSSATAAGVAKLQAALPQCTIFWDGNRPIGKIPLDSPPKTPHPTEPKPADPAVAAKDPERAVAEWVVKNGGQVSVYHHGGLAAWARLEDLPRGPIVVHGISVPGTAGFPWPGGPPLRDLKAIDRIGVAGTAVDDRWLEQVAGLKSLQQLGLNGTRITDEGLLSLQKLPRLQHLDIGHTKATSRGAGSLVGLTSLRSLNFPNADDSVWPHIARLERLNALTLDGNNLTNVGLRAAPPLPRVHSLNLSTSQLLDDTGLANLPTYPELRSLFLNKNEKITAAGVTALLRRTTPAEVYLDQAEMTAEQLAALQQQFPATAILHPKAAVDPRQKAAAEWAASLGMVGQLDLPGGGAGPLAEKLPEQPFSIGVLGGGAKIGAPADWAKLRDVRGLYAMHLAPDQATDDHLMSIWRALGDDPRLTQFGFVATDKVTSAGLAGLRRQTRLEHLTIAMPAFADADLAEIAPLKRLSYLDLESTGVTDAVFETAAGLPELQQLNVGSCNKLTGTGLARLKAARELTVLALHKCPVPDDALAALAEVPGLSVLHLDHTPLTDAGLEHLAKCRGLTILYAMGTNITAEGVAKFQAALPRCTVFWDGTAPDKQLAAP